MTTEFVTWKPDTCGCLLNMRYESTDAVRNPVHIHPEDALAKRPDLLEKVNGVIFAKATGIPFVENACGIHKGMSGPALYAVVLRENQLKNKVAKLARQVRPNLDEAREYRWSFEGGPDSRKLIVTDLQDAEKRHLQALCDTSMGAGSVEVR